MTEAREHRILALMAEAGWDSAVRAPLAGDASTRRYERLHLRGRTAILMDAPLQAEGPPCPIDASPEERARLGYNAEARLAACRVDAFVTIAARLHQLGLSAPQVYAFDAAEGLAVIEDLGGGEYAATLARGGDPTPFYEAAIDALARLHESPAPAVLQHGPARWPVLSYDETALLAEAALLPEWFLRVQLDHPLTDDQLADWRAAWRGTLAALAPSRPVLTLRDFHSPNLIWLPERGGSDRAGVIDFQDALAGHPAYDLASLLEDARRDVAPDFAAAMLARYKRAAAVIDGEALEAAFAVLAAQRNAKIIGVFARLRHRDGKPHYIALHQPRVLRYFLRDLSHPALAPVADWFARHAPMELWAPLAQGAAA